MSVKAHPSSTRSYPPNSLQSILKDEENNQSRAAFLRHCKKLCCEEAALFLVSVNRWHRLWERNFADREGAISRSFHDIIETYVQNGAPHQINVTHNVRQRLLDAACIESDLPKRNVFEECERAVIVLLSDGAYLSFLDELAEGSVSVLSAHVASAPTGRVQEKLLTTVTQPHLRSKSLEELVMANKGEGRNRNTGLLSMLSPRAGTVRDVGGQIPTSNHQRNGIDTPPVPEISSDPSMAHSGRGMSALLLPSTTFWRSPRVSRLTKPFNFGASQSTGSRSPE